MDAIVSYYNILFLNYLEHILLQRLIVFIEILRWDFDCIEVLAYEHGREEGERSFYIERKDLLPDIDTLKYFYAKYSEKIYPFWDNAYDRDRAEKNAEELFTHLMKEKLYYKFLCNCLFDISNSMEINTILMIYDYNNKIYINTNFHISIFMSDKIFTKFSESKVSCTIPPPTLFL